MYAATMYCVIRKKILGVWKRCAREFFDSMIE